MPALACLRPVFLFSLLIIAGVLALALHQTGGQFLYALDDVYIHLALASQLPDHFGTTPGIVSSPSSSLLYPWLLVPFSQSPFAPFLFNLAGLAVSLVMLCRIEEQVRPEGLYPARFAPLAVIMTAFAANLYTLPFLGLEHGLHVACSLAILSGLLDVHAGRPPRSWFWLALVLNPLFRYEGLALSGLALLWLLWKKPLRMRAVLAGTAILLIQAGYALWMHHQGLPWIPGSIHIKTDTQATGLPWLLASPLINLLTPGGGGLVLLLTCLALLSWKKPSPVALIILASVALHLLLGRIGWMDRYQAYVLALALPAIVWLTQEQLPTPARMAVLRAFLLIGLSVIAGQTGQTFASVPRAVHEMQLQHAQMVRFAKEYWQRPLAANDIGLLSWQNPQPVHDLFGLASEEVRRYRSEHQGWSASALDAYAKRHGLELAILYDSWFKGVIPASWLPLANLTYPGRPAVAAHNKVTFYALTPEAIPELRRLLEEWAKGLPAGVTLEMFPLQR